VDEVTPVLAGRRDVLRVVVVLGDLVPGDRGAPVRPTGTEGTTGGRAAAASVARLVSQYSRADDVAVFVSQYSAVLSTTPSRLSAPAGRSSRKSREIFS
jgi:hypothetical protein